MGVLEAVLYGIIQGIAEFLPISSSGHLALAQSIFGAKNPETDYFTFDVLLHLGTLIAVVIVFRKDLLQIVKAFFTLLKKLFTHRLGEGLTHDEHLTVLLMIATVPLVIGALLSNYVEALYSMPKIIGALLILNGCMLFLCDKVSKGTAPLHKLKYKGALFIGLIQLAGVLPGISRSGSTITGGLLTGLDRSEAVRFSFLLSVPAILGANILKLADIAKSPAASDMWLPFILGTAAAVIAGIGAIKLLEFIAGKNKFGLFTIYCAAVGLLALIFA